MATFDTVNTTGQSIPGGGMTLQALMQRQQELANAQGNIQQQQSPTIAGGLSQMLNAAFTGMRQSAASNQLAQARQQLGEAYGRIDPATGNFANPQDRALAMMLDPEGTRSMIASAVQNAQQLAMEKQREAFESGLPQTPRAKAMADYTSGKFGTVGSQEAIAARDAAIRASEAPELTLADRTELNRQTDDYIKTGASLNALNSAKSILGQGIDTGYFSGLKRGLSKLDFPGVDQGLASRTEQFKSIMEQQGAALVDTITKVLGVAQANSFVDIMNGTADVDTKTRTLDNMISQIQSYNDEQRQRIRRIDPSALPEIVAPQELKVGDVVDGYRYKGGPKGEQSSWEKVGP